MKAIKFICFLLILAGCKTQPVYTLPTSSLKLKEIVKWNDSLYFTDNVGDLYKLERDSLTVFAKDSIIDIKQCAGATFLLKAPDDSTLVIVNPDGSERRVKNRTELKSKHFKLHLNEKCQMLLEWGTAFFPIQDDKLIDQNKMFGFKNPDPNMSDNVGYYDNFVFLTKYPRYFSGGLFISYLDSSRRYDLPVDSKIRDFDIHSGQLLLAKGYHETIDGDEFMESELQMLGDGKINGMKALIPKSYGVSRIYSDGNDIYFLAEKLGFFRLTEGEPELLISINLYDSRIEPEKFIVDNGKIYLTTWEHGLLIFEGGKDDYDMKQIK